MRMDETRRWGRVALAAIAGACTLSACAGAKGISALTGAEGAGTQDRAKQQLNEGAHGASTSAAQGLLDQLDSPEGRERVNRIVGEATEQAGRRLVDGALAALDDPRQRARLRAAVDAAAGQAFRTALTAPVRPGARSGPEPGEGGLDAAPAGALSAAVAEAFTRAAARELVAQLGGETADGTPLAEALNATARRVAASSAVGIRGEAEGVGAVAGAGVLEGVRARLGPLPLVIAFALGALATFLVLGAWAGLRGVRSTLHRRTA
jgi:hypothetical protein